MGDTESIAAIAAVNVLLAAANRMRGADYWILSAYAAMICVLALLTM